MITSKMYNTRIAAVEVPQPATAVIGVTPSSLRLPLTYALARASLGQPSTASAHSVGRPDLACPSSIGKLVGDNRVEAAAKARKQGRIGAVKRKGVGCCGFVMKISCNFKLLRVSLSS